MEKGLTTFSSLWAIVLSVTSLYPLYAVTEPWTYIRVQPTRPECCHEESNDHICTSRISDIFPLIRLHGIGERNDWKAAKPEVFDVNTIAHTSELIRLVSLVTVWTPWGLSGIALLYRSSAVPCAFGSRIGNQFSCRQ
jgi:hypothetical protein